MDHIINEDMGLLGIGIAWIISWFVVSLIYVGVWMLAKEQ